MNPRTLVATTLALALCGVIVALILMSRPDAGKTSRAGAVASERRAAPELPKSDAPASPANISAEPARQPDAPPVESRPDAQASTDPPPKPAPRLSQEQMQPPTASPPAPRLAAPAPEPRKPAPRLSQNQSPLAQPVIPLPIARDALAFVGADPDAEEVWFQAINDPNLTAKQREDLIEDLNEVGIDPKNLTEDDIPLIVSRMQIIEELAPDAMDDVNAAAFAEAYKDLSNMLMRLMRQ